MTARVQERNAHRMVPGNRLVDTTRKADPAVAPNGRLGLWAAPADFVFPCTHPKPLSEKHAGTAVQGTHRKCKQAPSHSTHRQTTCTAPCCLTGPRSSRPTFSARLARQRRAGLDSNGVNTRWGFGGVSQSGVCRLAQHVRGKPLSGLAPHTHRVTSSASGWLHECRKECFFSPSDRSPFISARVHFPPSIEMTMRQRGSSASQHPSP